MKSKQYKLTLVSLFFCMILKQSDEACYQSNGMTADEKLFMLNEHNRLRQKVASGNEAKQPGATDMREMKWDHELEVVAQGYMDTCPSFQHNPNRATASYPEVGENLYMGSGGRALQTFNPNQLWYNEVANWTNSSISPFMGGSSGGVTGHFTQLIWSQSDKVGCGMVNFNGMTMVVCDYAIAGNLIDGTTAVYTAGTQDATCSKCPDGCADNNTALCKNCLTNEWTAKISPQTTSPCKGTTSANTTANSTNTTSSSNSTSNTTNTTTANSTNSTNNTTASNTTNASNSTANPNSTTSNNSATANQQNTASTTSTSSTTSTTPTDGQSSLIQQQSVASPSSANAGIWILVGIVAGSLMCVGSYLFHKFCINNNVGANRRYDAKTMNQTYATRNNGTEENYQTEYQD